jgi:thiamine-phosphate pyrophosphorylase
MDTHKRGLWRMLDANFNRCGEGLRVVEDWARFALEHAQLARQLKELRHDLHQLSGRWPLENRLAARDAATDVGRQIQTKSEYQRPESQDLIQANFYRVSQGLRVLEEVSKSLELDSAADLEQLRYRVYELHRQLLLWVARPVDPNSGNAAGDGDGPAGDGPTTGGGAWEKSIERRLSLLQQATLYVLVGPGDDFAAYQRHVRALLQAGVDVIQLRSKEQSDQAFWNYAQWTAQCVGPTETLFIVNDRCDIALASGADGVHLGQDELPIQVARQILGPQRLIGISTHDPAQVRQAHTTTANYLGLGPVFPSQTKSFSAWIGIEGLAACRPLIELPTFAIGGIDLDNQTAIRETGFSRIAVQNVLAPGRDLLAAVKKLRASVRSGR